MEPSKRQKIPYIALVYNTDSCDDFPEIDPTARYLILEMLY